MFGYVKTNKPELKIREYETYRGLYCSLCKALGKYFGFLARLTLSYDITFLLLSRLSFFAIVPDFKSGRCPFNPTKRCNYCLNSEEELKYAASVSMMMFYYKVKDNIEDSSFFKKLLLFLILPYATIKNKKAARFYPHIHSEIAQAMKNQSICEKENTGCPDAAAHNSAHTLGLIICEGVKDRETAYRFGYGIGKWVYLCDSADDIKKDLKKRNYNPFIIKYNITKEEEITEEIKEDIACQLNMSCALICEAYEKIKNKSLSTIIENIIYEGTEKTMKTILKGKV